MPATSLLRAADLRAGLRFVGAIAETAGAAEAFARVAVSELPKLVASELTTLSVCDLRSARRQVVASPGGALSAVDREAFDRHFHEHPLVRYHAIVRGTGAHRISDALPLGRFRATPLYADYYRRIGIDHAVALPIEVDDRTLVSLVLNRRRRDFTDRECALLDAVGSCLRPLYRRSATAGSSATPAPGFESTPPDAIASASAADARGLALTAREREVLQWVGAGKTDRDIAELLGRSHRTVQKHLENIYRKLGVETRTAAVMRAFRPGGAPRS